MDNDGPTSPGVRSPLTEVRAGSGSSLDAVIALYKRDVDRTLLREQLRKTPDERVRELVELEALLEESAAED